MESKEQLEAIQKQFEELMGPSSPSDHVPGDVVTYTDGDELAEGKVIYTRAAGPVREGGPVLRAGHIVESGKGWPRYVPLGKVVE